MPKLPYIEIFLGYEILVRILQQQQKCITSLKIVNSKSINLKVLSILYSLQCQGVCLTVARGECISSRASGTPVTTSPAGE